jgi:hypothetical protein
MSDDIKSWFTFREMEGAARHEATMRRRVYQNWCDQRRSGWNQARVDKGVAVMEAIADHFALLADEQDARGRLL